MCPTARDLSFEVESILDDRIEGENTRKFLLQFRHCWTTAQQRQELCSPKDKVVTVANGIGSKDVVTYGLVKWAPEWIHVDNLECNQLLCYYNDLKIRRERSVVANTRKLPDMDDSPHHMVNQFMERGHGDWTEETNALVGEVLKMEEKGNTFDTGTLALLQARMAEEATPTHESTLYENMVTKPFHNDVSTDGEGFLIDDSTSIQPCLKYQDLLKDWEIPEVVYDDAAEDESSAISTPVPAIGPTAGALDRLSTRADFFSLDLNPFEAAHPLSRVERNKWKNQKKAERQRIERITNPKRWKQSSN